MKRSYPETVQRIWHSQPKANTLVMQQVDIELQFKFLSTFSVGEFYWYIVDIMSGDFEYISPELEKILGYDPNVLTVQQFIESIHPDDISFFINAENTIVIFFSKLPVERFFDYKVRYDYRVRKSDGT